MAIMLLVNLFIPQKARTQTPQKMSYQAVIRDATNQLVTDQDVGMQISILQGSSSGSSVYTETQTPTTNANGLVSIEIGEGSSTDDFSSIDWSAGTYFIKTETDPTGGTNYSITGTTQLISVPYALFAEEASKAESLGSDGVYSTNSDTLFVVKDHDGNVVFSVFPDGAEVIVNETAKGKVGGFAVSGRSPNKADDLGILRITADSTRIYINDTLEAKGKVGGFAISGRSPNKGTSEDYFNVSGSTDAEIIDPSEARILWYPNKESFMAGRVLVEDPDSVGLNSWATGFESKAIGDYSQALGYQAKARGNSSTAIGNMAEVNSPNSYAIGNSASVSGEGSYAIGSGALAQGDFSFAIGSDGIDAGGFATNVTRALGTYSYAFGMGSLAENTGSFSIGSKTEATGEYSLAMGNLTVASGFASTAMGDGTEASGERATAIGFWTTASGTNSMAMGHSTTAIGESSTAMGKFSEASGFISTAMGQATTASGEVSTAIGNGSVASGHTSVAIGGGVEASGVESIALGRSSHSKGKFSCTLGAHLTAKSFNEVVVGSNNDTTYSITTNSWVLTEPIFTVGNAPPGGAGKNALMVLKNGSVGIGGYPGATGANVLAINTTGIGHQPPTDTIPDGVLLFAQDINFSTELRVMDGGGNVTTLSPHSFTLTKKSEPMAWSFYSENKQLGYEINVDMLKAIRTIEQLSGEKLVYMKDMVTQQVVEQNEYDESLLELIERQKAEIDDLKQKIDDIMKLLEEK